MIPFYLSLGANIGDRCHHLKEAILRLRTTPGIEINTVSSIYETDPVGFLDQPPFLNMAAGGKTFLSPEDLLKRILAVEQELGRERKIRWGPRTVDIDILTYGGWTLNRDDLQIPHPRMSERAFVLVPLAEIAPQLPVPLSKSETKTPLEMLQNVKDKSGVRKWMNFEWEIESVHFES